ncbi:MAG: hypothetical protein AAGJ97_11900, partial [Planctomycetota bacterium]
ARDFLRARRRRCGYGLSNSVINKLVAVSKGTYEVAELREELLHGCLDDLSGADRRMFRECYGGGVAASEWARRNGKNENSVYTRLRRLRKRLFECVNRKMAASQ